MEDKQARIAEIRKKIRALNIQNSKRQAWQIGAGVGVNALGNPLLSGVLHPTLSAKRRQAEKEIRKLEAELRELTGNTIDGGDSYRITGSGTDNDRKIIITGQDGKTYTFDMSYAKSGINDGYKANNARYGATMTDVTEAFIGLMTTGKIPTAADLGVNPKEYGVIMDDVKTMATRNGITLKEDADGTLIIAGGTNVPPSAAKKIEAEIAEASGPDPLNAYYNDLYSLDEGTGGRAMYDALLNANMAEARAGYNVADLQQQQAAMQQAATVKQIADQVRAERMARLRAGMSESQIANQDMQMMMTNVQALNDQSLAASQARYDAMTGMELAQHNAYREYLAQADARGQNAAAMYAVDAGNPITMTDLYRSRMLLDPTYNTFFDPVTGQQRKDEKDE